ncbi:unnamed protein product [Discosporangium mesarthrocarpum]
MPGSQHHAICLYSECSCQSTKRDVPTVQMMTAGSAPPPSVMKELKEELGIQALASYGLTEVGHLRGGESSETCCQQ